MKRPAAFFAALCALLPVPAAAQEPAGAAPLGPPATSINVVGSLHNYQINGWQVRCWGGRSGDPFSDCVARKAFGPLEATIGVGDNYLHFEVIAPCLDPPAHYKTRSWDRRQPIATIDVARVLAAALGDSLRACGQGPLPDNWAYEPSDLMALFLAAVPIPAYVTMGLGRRQ